MKQKKVVGEIDGVRAVWFEPVDEPPVVLQEPPAAVNGPAVIRRDRNRALAASDWTQLADAPLTKAEKTAWKKYRAALRDVTSQDGFPQIIIWPQAPLKGKDDA